jgi:branched-chain amino acid transport system permease protein
MQYVLQHLVDALSVGSSYVLLALGLTLVFSVMGLINFAYGNLIVWGGYVIIGLSMLHLSLPLVIVGLIAATTLISFLMGQVAFRPFRGAPPITLLLSSVGVSFAMQAVAIMAFGEISRGVPTPQVLGEGVNVGNVHISYLQLLTIGAAIVVLVGLNLLIQRTTLGIKFRCVAEDNKVAELMGIRYSRILLYVFVISGVIAGVVTYLWFAKLGSVNPRVDLNPTLKAFIAITLGGIGTVRGAVIGGLVLGLFESLLAAQLPSALLSYQSALTFLLVIVVLVLRPQGIAGRVLEVSK